MVLGTLQHCLLQYIKQGPAVEVWTVELKIKNLAIVLRQINAATATVVGDCAELAEMKRAELATCEIDKLHDFLGGARCCPEVVSSLKFARGTLAKFARGSMLLVLRVSSLCVLTKINYLLSHLFGHVFDFNFVKLSFVEEIV